MKKRIYIIFLISAAILGFAYSGAMAQKQVDYGTKINSFLKKYTKTYNIVRETLLYKTNDVVLDRLDTAFKKSVTLKSKRMVKVPNSYNIYQRFFLGFYNFENDSLAIAALDSVLNCIGTDCAKFTRGDSGKPLKTVPFIYIRNKNKIIAAKINCAHDNIHWQNFRKDLLKNFAAEDSDIIESACGGPVNIKIHEAAKADESEHSNE